MKNLFLLLFLACAAGAAQKPNVILVMVDDLGRDWVTCYGAKHQTPNLDRLAKEGVRYETAWSMPIGTPTEIAAFMSSRPVLALVLEGDGQADLTDFTAAFQTWIGLSLIHI